MKFIDEHFRAPLLWLLAPYLVGLVLGAAGLNLAGPLAVGLAVLLGAAACVISWRSRASISKVWAGLLALAALLGGVVHLRHALDPFAAQARWSGLPPREATLTVEVVRLFGGGGQTDRRLCIGRVVQAPPLLDDLRGQRVFFALKRTADADVVRTMHLEVRGILRLLERWQVEPGGFEEFLLRSGVLFMLQRAEQRAVVRAASPVAAWLHDVHGRFGAILRHGLPASHPATPVYIGMFLGEKSELSDAQKESYLRSGTMHLFAISGLHIAVIAACLHGLLTVARMPGRVQMIVGLLALWVFVEATGGTPSARRAFLMVAFVWAGTALRRPANPLASLVASAFFVLVLDPLALLSASFQLSYSVVAALLLYGLPLRNRWQARWKPWRDHVPDELRWWHRLIDRQVRNAMGLAAISCAATLISTPLSIAYFQLASPGAVLSNLVLVPITAGAIGAGFASLVCGLVGLPMLSVVFNHAGALILAVVDQGAAWAARIPGMFFEAGFNASWIGPLIVLGLLAVLVAGYARGWDRFPGRAWTPPLMLIVLVVFLVSPVPAGQESAAMKSAYELAMERLKKSDPTSGPELTAEQKARLAEIDRVYQGKVAEREIFLQQRLAEAQTAGRFDDVEKIRQQIAGERARLEEEREDEKNKIRRGAEKRA